MTKQGNSLLQFRISCISFEGERGVPTLLFVTLLEHSVSHSCLQIALPYIRTTAMHCLWLRCLLGLRTQCLQNNVCRMLPLFLPQPMLFRYPSLMRRSMRCVMTRNGTQVKEIRRRLLAWNCLKRLTLNMLLRSCLPWQMDQELIVNVRQLHALAEHTRATCCET